MAELIPAKGIPGEGPGEISSGTFSDGTVASTAGDGAPFPIPHQRVVLTGFMGAGKSTVGRLLAPLLGWSFIDADAALTERVGATIADLFATHGEGHFRQLEAVMIAELMATERTVIALGGGAVEHTGTQMLLGSTPATLVVYLEAPLAISMDRCRREPGAALRPILQDATHLEARFQRRLPLYRTAHLTIATDGQTPSEIAQTIADAIRRE